MADVERATGFAACFTHLRTGSSTADMPGLSLVTAAIIHWNTVYLDLAVRRLRTDGIAVPDEKLAHIAPLEWEHISLTGDYDWAAASPPPGGFRPLRDVRVTRCLL